MKKLLFFFISLTLLALFSCTDENIGESITDIQSTIVQDSAFTVTGVSVANPHVLSRATTSLYTSSGSQALTVSQLLGELNDNGFGQLKSEVVTQFMPAAALAVDGVTIDSCRLALRIFNDGFTGDSLAPMRMDIYRLNRQLPSPIYSDFNPTDYYNPADKLASITYSAASTTIEEVTSSSTGETYRALYVPMPLSLAQELLDEYKNNPATYDSPDNFTEFFKGMYFKNSYGTGRVMNFYNTEFQVFYQQHVTTEELDTVYKNLLQTYMGATPEVLSNNNISLTISPQVKQRVNDGQAIVMAPCGYEVGINLPVQDVIDHYLKATKGEQSVINSFSLEIPAEDLGTQFAIEPPKYLLLIRASEKDKFFEDSSLPDNKRSFYAEYNKQKRAYVFSSLRYYLTDIIANHNAVATADDTEFILTPVDVSTYTVQATYYSSAQTVVTKVAPAVSAPAIARLKLDDAKLKVVFSKQSIF